MVAHNYSKMVQKISHQNESIFGVMTSLQPAAASRVSVMQWRLDVIKNTPTVFGIGIKRKFHEIND